MATPPTEPRRTGAMRPASFNPFEAAATAERRLRALSPEPETTWEEVEADESFTSLEAGDQSKVKEYYFQNYVAPTGKSWDAFQNETAAGPLEQVWGATQGTLGGFQQSGAYVAGAMGFEDTEKDLLEMADANMAQAARTQYVSKYGEVGWGQIKNVLDLGWWQSLVTETLPQSAPFMAAAGTGAVLGSALGPLGALVGAMILGGGMAAFQELGGAYYEFLEAKPGDIEGANEYAASKAALTMVINAASIPLAFAGMPAGVATSMLAKGGLTATQKAATKTLGNVLKHGLVQMGVQGTIGAGDTASQNAVRKMLLDPSQPLDEGLLKSFFGEAIVDAPGFVAGLQAAARRRNMVDPDAGGGGIGSPAGGEQGAQGPADLSGPGGDEAVGAEQLFGAEEELDEAGFSDAPNPGPVDQTQVPAEPEIPPEMAPPEAVEGEALGAIDPGEGPPGVMAPEDTAVAAEDLLPPPMDPTPPGSTEDDAIEAAASEADIDPSDAQKEAGNYKKGHINLQGMDISIENPAGSTRSGTNKAGKTWETEMAHHYGYIKGTKGADKDHLDVFIGPNPSSEMVYVVDQIDPDTGKFDEHKIMLGFEDQMEAEDGYLANYEEGWRGDGAVSELFIDDFKEWLKGDTTKPFKYNKETDFEGEGVPEEAPEPERPSKTQSEPASGESAGTGPESGAVGQQEAATEAPGVSEADIDTPKAEDGGEKTPKFKNGDKVTLPDGMQGSIAGMYTVTKGDVIPTRGGYATTEPSYEHKYHVEMADGTARESVDQKDLKAGWDAETTPPPPAKPEKETSESESDTIEAPPKEKGDGRTEGVQKPVRPVRDSGVEALEGEPPEDVRRPEKGGAPAESPAGRPGTDVEGPAPDNGAEGADRAKRHDATQDGGGDRPAEVHPAPERERGTGNYRITDADELGTGGPVAKYEANLKAIETLKQIEDEGRRPATAEEQAILVKYAGWGGLPQAFNFWQEKDQRWRDRNKRLVETLTAEEFQSARASTLNAHFTSKPVIDFIWGALERMGFSGGRVLEPSMGVGHFIGLAPRKVHGASKFTGVELDSITGRIGNLLYPQSDIRVQGFEGTRLPNGYFDLAISNVPFGDYTLRYNKRPYRIHNFFFIKSLDLVRPGGLVAFITSAGTMDARGNADVRREIAKHADLVAAFRLPGDAFKSTAGTEVTTDLIILQKWGGGTFLKEGSTQWADSAHQDLPPGPPVTVSEYFKNNPSHMLGELVRDKLHPNRAGLKLRSGDTMEGELAKALEKVPRDRFQADAPKVEDPEPQVMIPAPDDLKEGAYTIEDGKVFRNIGSQLQPVKAGDTGFRRIKDMIEVRSTVRDVLRTQLDDASEGIIKDARQGLNKAYDAFVKRHGPVNSKANTQALGKDPDFPLLASLEKYDPETNKATKEAIFTERTIQRQRPVERTDTGKEAMVVSLNERGRVDMAHMSTLSGKSESGVITELKGVIYENPETGQWETSDQYLAGNVRRKLEQARLTAEMDPRFEENVKALEDVQPEDLPPSVIDAKLGAPWIPTETVQTFIQELLGQSTKVLHAESVATWKVEVGQFNRGSVASREEWGTTRVDAIDMIEMSLNLRKPTVTDYDPSSDSRKVNASATAEAREKQSRIQDRFKEWLWNDDDRVERLGRIYNDQYNNSRLQTYDGSHLTLPGSSPAIQLRPHQKTAVWRIIQSPNTLLAHEVGAGKTFAMIAGAMELKRLGLAKKPLFAVPNHLVDSGQFLKDFLALYPGANVLAATSKDFAAKNRNRLMTQIATGNWDAVLVGHSSFAFIPVSEETENSFYRDQIGQLQDAIMEARAEQGKGADNRLVKELEAAKKRLEAKLDRLKEKTRKDDVVTFEELGVDRLFVDEAHNYKNLFVVTKMGRVPGIPNTASGKAFDLMMKSRYVQDFNGGSGLVFSTATPISNTMVEIFTMLRYLDPKGLREMGVEHFDAWAASFGEQVSAMELAPDGSGYRMHTRFSRFINMPELQTQFRTVADVQTQDMLNLPKPKLKGGKPTTVPAPATEDLKAYVQTLVKRAEKIKGQRPEKGADNMLAITTDGRKAAMDMRLVDPTAEENPDGKINMLVRRAYEIWERSAAEKSAQMIFADFSAPKGKGDLGFSAYNDVREKLIKRGIPADEIAFIQEHKAPAMKSALFENVRKGKVRVLLGSTAMMGEGTNVQTKLIALHHLDAPWRPSDIEQRNGRILRQGNENPEVEVFQYVSEGSFDAYMWQTLENKARFIGQVMKGEAGVRTAEDVDQVVLNAAEVKAIASGNPLVMEKAEVDAKMAKLSIMARSHADQQWRLKRTVKDLTARIADAKKEIKAHEGDIAKRKSTKGDEFTITINGTEYTEREKAGEALLALGQEYKNRSSATLIGEFAGFSLHLQMHKFIGTEGIELAMLGNREYNSTRRIEEVEPAGLIQSLENRATRGPESEIAKYTTFMGEAERDIGDSEKLIGKDFEQQGELDTLGARQKELFEALDLNKDRDAESGDSEEGEAAEAKESRARPGERKPVNLVELRRRADHVFGLNSPEIRVVKDLYSQENDLPISGQYARDVVTLAEWAQDPKGTFNHELFHHAMEALLNQADRNLVRMAFRTGSRENAAVVGKLEERGDDAAARHATGDAEEAAAYAWELYSKREHTLRGATARIFQRLRDSLRRLMRWATGQDGRTVWDVFRELDQGRYEGRVEETGAFGPIYHQFRGRPNDAIEHLIRVRRGEVPGALYHPAVGEIDLVWGNDQMGLQHLINYPERGTTLAREIPSILEDGIATKETRRNRIRIETEQHRVVIRLDWDKKSKRWLMTTFELGSPPAGKRSDTSSTESGSMSIPEPAEGSKKSLPQKPEKIKESRARPADLMKRETATEPRKLTDKLLNIPFRLLPVNRAYGALMDKLGAWVPERVKAGLVDRWGETDEMKAARLRYQHLVMENIKMVRSHAQRLMMDRDQSRIAYEWMSTNNAAEESRLMALLPEESREQMAEIKDLIASLGREAVRLGLVTKDSFERNKNAYLRRSYTKHEISEDGSLPRQRRIAKKVLADNLKMRGVKQRYKFARLMREVGGEWARKAAPGGTEGIKGQKFIRLTTRNVHDKLHRIAYWPEGEPLPDRFTNARSNWNVDADEGGAPNLWEARWTSTNEVGFWRDLSAGERDTLGEIDEIRYAVSRTLIGMTHDIEVARHFQYLAAHRGADGDPDWVVTDPGMIPEGHTIGGDPSRFAAPKPTEWVKVPNTIHPKTPKVAMYGVLAGKYVIGPVWNEIRQVTGNNRAVRWEFFNDVVRWFKISKTALSPKTGVNNVMANLWFSEWADIRASSILSALDIYIKAARGDAAAQETLDDFYHSGAGYGTFAAQELRDEILEPMQRELAQELARRGLRNPDNNPMGASRALALVNATLTGLRKVKDKAVDLYALEDNLFRLAAYRQKMSEGLSSEKAAAFAVDAFLDYDISAPWVQIARQVSHPFIAFSYRAIPKLHQMAKERPYKLLKMALVMGTLNAAAYAFVGADEEEERRLMDERKAGKVLGLFHRQVRMPWNWDGHPVFLDVVRWIPAGDLFLWQETNTAIPILPFMVPGGPLEWTMELLANKNFYTGMPITKETDSKAEMVKKVMAHLWKGIAPNMVLIPGTYEYDRIFPSLPSGVKSGLRTVGLGAETPAVDPFGREYPSLLAVLNAMGMKIATHPKDVLTMRAMQNANRLINEIEREKHALAMRYSRGGMDLRYFEKRMNDLRDKAVAIAGKTRDKLAPRKAG